MVGKGRVVEKEMWFESVAGCAGSAVDRSRYRCNPSFLGGVGNQWERRVSKWELITPLRSIYQNIQKKGGIV